MVNNNKRKTESDQNREHAPIKIHLRFILSFEWLIYTVICFVRRFASLIGQKRLIIASEKQHEKY